MNLDNQPHLYRVNFGNGQATSPMIRRAAEQWLATHKRAGQYAAAFIQFKDPETNEWVSLRYQ